MAERFGKGNVDRIGGLWVLHLGGTSFERGLQHGTLMRYRVRDTIDFYRRLPETLASRVIDEGSFKLKTLNKLKRNLVKRFIKDQGSDALEEARGLSVGLGMRFEDLVEALVLADVMQFVGARAGKNRRVGPPLLAGFACTSAIRETPARGMLFARNFDFWGAGYWDANPAIVFHHPDRGKAFCSITTAGFPTCGATAMNEDGLAVAVHQHGSLDSSLKGKPILDITHNVVRNASSVDEAIDICSGFRATGGWSLVVAGGSPGGAAVIEMSYGRQAPRFLSQHSLVATNCFQDEKLSSMEIQANISAKTSDQARFRRASDLVAGPRMTPTSMAGILGDHLDPVSGVERSAGFSISRITTLSSVVFSLHDKKFWVSESPAPASTGGFVGFDLDAELERGKSSVGRLEGGKPPALSITSAQNRYLDAYKEYINSGDLNRLLIILGECSIIDEEEATFPFMEGITRSMVGNLKGALASVERAADLEAVEPKRSLMKLWKARILDMMDRRERALEIYGELAGDEDVETTLSKAAAAGVRKPYREKNLAALLLDFTNGDIFE